MTPQDESAVDNEDGELPTVVTPPTSRAMERLIVEAQSQLSSGDLQSAIATAERGLRIDRREPQLYYILAKSYYGLDDDYRARQFAEQGLRYVQNPESDLAVALQQLMEPTGSR